ncbi:hypothetical protein [Jannaschia ovalis]|uniref:Methanogenic corrinoid protein MtbC1 n=1 Tax=Jannaschia ovalis TaxID=3038773 RepID=A0ABY8LG36_9RHOB|nr:hypothetical protein [Jannaschia sp. GRR-S6-38]WGH80259.1 hypothetical protein P8627_08345 [Jannaschia sp. GRR-S6-38]
MTTPYDDTTKVIPRVLVPAIAERGDGHDLVDAVLRLAGVAPVEPAADSALVVLGERVFLHSEDFARRALLDLARGDAILRVAMLTRVLPAITRRLESGWNDDRLSFVDVTIAAARIQDAVRRLGHFALPPAEKPAIALIVPHWEQHSLAAVFAAEEMRRMGAPVRLISGVEGRRIPAMIERFPAAALMVSVGSGHSAARLTDLVRLLRRDVQRALPVVVGGPAVAQDRGIGQRLRADLTTNSVAEALSFCDMEPCRSQG